MKPQDYDKWLSPMVTKVKMLVTLINPLPLGEMESREVGDHVRQVSFKNSECTEPRR